MSLFNGFCPRWRLPAEETGYHPPPPPPPDDESELLEPLSLLLEVSLLLELSLLLLDSADCARTPAAMPPAATAHDALAPAPPDRPPPKPVQDSEAGLLERDDS